VEVVEELRLLQLRDAVLGSFFFFFFFFFLFLRLLAAQAPG
jgi:hypothetical protein